MSNIFMNKFIKNYYSSGAWVIPAVKAWKLGE